MSTAHLLFVNWETVLIFIKGFLVGFFFCSYRIFPVASQKFWKRAHTAIKGILMTFLTVDDHMTCTHEVLQTMLHNFTCLLFLLLHILTILPALCSLSPWHLRCHGDQTAETSLLVCTQVTPPVPEGAFHLVDHLLQELIKEPDTLQQLAFLLLPHL